MACQSDDAVQKGVVLAENVNDTKLGFMGIQNVLTSALAPAFTDLVAGLNELIKAFIESYNEGGFVKEVFVLISGAIEICIGVVQAFGQIFSAVGSAVEEISAQIGAATGQTFAKDVPASSATPSKR
jgi:hypothetical protein